MILEERKRYAFGITVLAFARGAIAKYHEAYMGKLEQMDMGFLLLDINFT